MRTLEHAAGADAAAGHLRALATLRERTGYAGALLGAHDVALAVLPLLARAGSNGPADALSAVLADPERGDGAAAAEAPNAAELDVLACLARGRQDKQIAAELRLSIDGVRDRIRRIFAKLGARDREDAVRGQGPVAVGLKVGRDGRRRRREVGARPVDARACRRRPLCDTAKT